MKRVGERIKDQRIKLGWTQDQLCTKAGVSKGFLSDLERNNRRVSADKLLDLASVLGLSLDFLMKGSAEELNQQDVSVPAALARFAESEGLGFRTTIMLLDMQRQIIANRSTNRENELESVNWKEFYEAVKEFL